MVIKGYRHVGVGSGAAIVTVDGAMLALPAIDPRREARHSPSGFEWGYPGSGPAELARAILLAVIPGDPLARCPGCYMRFKDDVVARLRADVWTMTGDAVLGWLEAFRASHPTIVQRVQDLAQLERDLAVMDAELDVQAPVGVFAGWQERYRHPRRPLALFTLRRALPGHGAGSTVSHGTLEALGVPRPLIPCAETSRPCPDPAVAVAFWTGAPGLAPDVQALCPVHADGVAALGEGRTGPYVVSLAVVLAPVGEARLEGEPA